MSTKKDFDSEDAFMQVASQLVVYQIKTAWLQIQKMGDKIASKHDASLSMAFMLMAIYEESGTPVTKIAPRIGMEPNSLSRLLKSLENKKYIYKEKDKDDKRVVLIRLTALGIERREFALRAVFKMEKAVLKEVADTDLKGFFRVMGVVNESLGKDV
ncbi:MAG: DNA-binding MarR family transcriptional regulator [Chitinophagales bacterium]|jgi:DNA-binding MarR family transcriptional regulator